MHQPLTAATVALALTPIVSFAQLVVTEVMYDPASDESRWEWIEVHNTGPVAIDLHGYVIDRVGDRERTTVTPNILGHPLRGLDVVDNPTVLPAGGIAVLYNGPGLGYDPGRFRAAWPQTPRGATLIGVEGWSSNALTNAPSVSDYAPSLPAMTVGLWADEAAYRLDAADFGTPGSPDRRIFRVANAVTALGYDDNAPWRDPQGKSAIHYLGGPIFQPSSWGRSNAGFGGASASVTTFMPVPISAGEYGSPGIVPTGSPVRSGLLVTELMYDAASTTGANNEWEWIEVYNSGPTIDFAATPYWLDDDDEAPLVAANLTAGTIATGGVGVLFNASAATLTQMQTAWDRPGRAPINWIAVNNWPSLANGGDTIGLWDDAADYASDHAGEVATFHRAALRLAYDDSSPWPTGVDGDAIRLANLGSDPVDPAAWARPAPTPTPTPTAPPTSSCLAESSTTPAATTAAPATTGPTSTHRSPATTRATAWWMRPTTLCGATARRSPLRPPPPASLTRPTTRSGAPTTAGQCRAARRRSPSRQR